jgi:protease I
MENRLTDVRIAVLATDGFEESELQDPISAYRKEGAQVTLVSPKSGSIRGWKHKNWSGEVTVDKTLDQAKAGDFDALHLPGGVINPDMLRMQPKAVEFVKAFFREGKPVGAICHGPWMLAEADVVRGKKVTSWPSLHTDLVNAGANWVDEEVVQDGNLITSRKPDDLLAYCEKTIEAFSKAAQPVSG